MVVLKRLAFGCGVGFWVLVCGLAFGEGDGVWPVDSADEWAAVTGAPEGVSVTRSPPVGGRSDLMGEGALLLAKGDPAKAFWKQTAFVESGTWTSAWRSVGELGSGVLLEATVQVYGKPQEMGAGWVKFSGNPLVCDYEWPLASAESLQLPARLHDRGNDQSLAFGAGPFAGQWLLFFNIGSWAVKGWAMAVAPSLELLKAGENPFRLYESPYPLFEGTGGQNAPNDWLYANGVWYAPDETKGGPSHMWTAESVDAWTNAGEIVGINGHDPGMVYDGERYYLFNETEGAIVYCSAADPLGPWTDHGVAFETGSHTGDADVAFFNNRWHMVYDDGPHTNYELGYAWTTAEEFPLGWRLTRQFFGPRNPDQGQQWDEPTEDGNAFGTGDGDWAVEGSTVYLVYERPIGVAWKELAVTDGDGVTAEVRVAYDGNGDGAVDAASRWEALAMGDSAVSPALGGVDSDGRYRIEVRLATEDAGVSPMVTRLGVRAAE